MRSGGGRTRIWTQQRPSGSCGGTVRGQDGRGLALLEADTAIGRLPDDLAGRKAVISSGRSQRRAMVKSVWAPGKVDGAAKEWEDALEAVTGDVSYDAYYGNRLSVTKWEELEQTHRDVVEVTFTGHMDYRGRGWKGWAQEPLTRFHVKLDRVDGDADWRLGRRGPRPPGWSIANRGFASGRHRAGSETDVCYGCSRLISIVVSARIPGELECNSNQSHNDDDEPGQSD
jgi:hypothetical protein